MGINIIKTPSVKKVFRESKLQTDIYGIWSKPLLFNDDMIVSCQLIIYIGLVYKAETKGIF